MLQTSLRDLPLALADGRYGAAIICDHLIGQCPDTARERALQSMDTHSQITAMRQCVVLRPDVVHAIEIARRRCSRDAIRAEPHGELVADE